VVLFVDFQIRQIIFTPGHGDGSPDDDRDGAPKELNALTVFSVRF
jgi:hypothetical protein